MTTYKDNDLREALRRKYADTPQMPADFLDRMRQNLGQQQACESPQCRYLFPRWLLHSAIGAVVASVLLLVFFHSEKNTTEQQPVAQVKKPTSPESADSIPLTTQKAKKEEAGDVMLETVKTEPVRMDKTVAFQPHNKRQVPELANTAKHPIIPRPVTPAPKVSKPKKDSINIPVPNDTNATESIAFYIARLEAEMDALDDSVNVAHIEELIAADARLQQLVNRIVLGKVGQAWNETQKDSTANYINF